MTDKQMKKAKISKALSVVVLLVFAAMPVAQAQRGRGPGHCMSRYDPATEITLNGTVEKVSEQTGRMGWKGTHLFLKTHNEAVEVHLGPSSFTCERGVSFAQGDRIEVTGSMVSYQEGNTILLARQIKKGDVVLRLRDSTGKPEWSRGGRGRQGRGKGPW